MHFCLETFSLGKQAWIYERITREQEGIDTLDSTAIGKPMKSKLNQERRYQLSRGLCTSSIFLKLYSGFRNFFQIESNGFI